MKHIQKYVLPKHKEKYESKPLNIIKHSNQFYDGMSTHNTDYMQKPTNNTYYPKQHPKNLDYSSPSIISYFPSPKPLTPLGSLPPSAAAFSPPQFESPMNSKSIEICVVGNRNSGKSSIINSLSGKTISAVSGIGGTTSEGIIGVFMEENTQVCLFDTPGSHLSQGPSSTHLITRGWDLISNSDKVMFVVDASTRLNRELRMGIRRLMELNYSPEEDEMRHRIKTSRNLADLPSFQEVEDIQNKEIEGISGTVSKLLVFNKMDQISNQRKVRELRGELEDLGDFDKVFFVSCSTGYGLVELKKYLLESAYRRPYEYSPAHKSMQSEVEKAEEILSQTIYSLYFKELPHRSTVECKSWVPLSNGTLLLEFKIGVSNNIQRGIILGPKGRFIRKLGEIASAQMASDFQRPVKLTFEVTTRNKYRNTHQPPRSSVVTDPKVRQDEIQQKVKERASKLGGSEFIHKGLLDT